MYKVVYERAGCIGAAACAAVYPKRWVMADSDGKADLVDSTPQEDQDGFFEFSFTEDELEDFITSAQVCPVTVIHVFDPDGTKLV